MGRDPTLKEKSHGVTLRPGADMEEPFSGATEPISPRTKELKLGLVDPHPQAGELLGA